MQIASEYVSVYCTYDNLDKLMFYAPSTHRHPWAIKFTAVRSGGVIADPPKLQQL
jgi:hypothetical protein